MQVAVWCMDGIYVVVWYMTAMCFLSTAQLKWFESYGEHGKKSIELGNN